MSAPAAVPEAVAAASGGRPAVPFLRGARAVFDLSLEGMLWSRRTVFMGLLLLVPAAFAVLYRILLATGAATTTARVLYGNLVAYAFVRHILPLAALFYASSLIADEVEDRTITYFFTRPVRRSSVLFGKFAAYLATATTVALPSIVLTFFLLMTARGNRLAAAAPDLLRDLSVTALTLAAYGALFTLFGVLLKRPILAGLFVVFGWEYLSALPGWAPRLTLTAWLRSLLRHRPVGEEMGEFAEILPTVTSLAVVSVVTVLCLALAAWIFARRQYVLEQ